MIKLTYVKPSPKVTKLIRELCKDVTPALKSLTKK